MKKVIKAREVKEVNTISHNTIRKSMTNHINTNTTGIIIMEETTTNMKAEKNIQKNLINHFNNKKLAMCLKLKHLINQVN